MRWWKWVGLAGLLGVATTAGVIAVTRSRARTWTDYTPEEMRERLHARLAGAGLAAGGEGTEATTGRSLANEAG